MGHEIRIKNLSIEESSTCVDNWNIMDVGWKILLNEIHIQDGMGQPFYQVAIDTNSNELKCSTVYVISFRIQNTIDHLSLNISITIKSSPVVLIVDLTAPTKSKSFRSTRSYGMERKKDETVKTEKRKPNINRYVNESLLRLKSKMKL